MTDYFAQHGFAIDAVHDGRTGLTRSLEGAYDLIILDVMLPVLDGFELLRQLRKRSTTPVIMLTARTAQRDRIAGLNAGADDYLPKPFGPEELLARIRAVLRRTGHTETVPPQTVEAGRVRLDPLTRHALFRDELTTVLYRRPATPYERALDVHISHLRKKLECDGQSSIRTIRGVGYQFAP